MDSLNCTYLYTLHTFCAVCFLKYIHVIREYSGIITFVNLNFTRHIQAELEHDNEVQKKKLEEERRRAKMATERAKQMIKVGLFIQQFEMHVLSVLILASACQFYLLQGKQTLRL